MRERSQITGRANEMISKTPRVDVWICRLDVAEDRLSNWRRLLSSDEIERSERFVFKQDRAKFVAARGQLREILSKYALIAPRSIEFGYQEYGKPYLKQSGTIHFNLSHSSFLSAVAVSNAENIGIDIEQIRPVNEDIAARYFSASECSALDRLAPTERLRGFYNVWTRKEAVIKALGSGLSMLLDSFDVSVESHVEVRLERLNDDMQAGEKWALAAFEPYPGFVGALAVPTRSRSIEVKLLTSE